MKSLLVMKVVRGSPICNDLCIKIAKQIKNVPQRNIAKTLNHVCA